MSHVWRQKPGGPMGGLEGAARRGAWGADASTAPNIALYLRDMTREELIAILRSEAGREETRKVRDLGRAIDFVEHAIYSRQISRMEAEEMADAAAKIAEQYFPGSSDTFAIVYGRRLRRVIAEVFGAAS
jgi:hypothetical protein